MGVNINTHHQSKISGRFNSSLERAREFLATLEDFRKYLAAHAWIECIVLALKPLSFVESVAYRRHCKRENNCRNTFLLCLRKMTGRVKKKIRGIFSLRFDIVLDGLSNGEPRHVGFFAIYSSRNAAGYGKLFC